ncbi:MAG TPA: vanadium-dependent haloperoxidase, partial [Thermoanaerobaculia bacterium]|nr:vanadium-dependent haloperoxidase [Thermoanaerobaculia bacterium]
MADVTRRDLFVLAGTGIAAASSPLLASTADPRAARAYDLRVQAAAFCRDQPRVRQPVTGDEDRYEDRRASYSKGLPHDARGEVDRAAFDAFLAAMRSGSAEELERIPLGGYLKLANPHAALAFDLVGPDSHQLTIPPPPRYDSPELAADTIELYWKALLRDVAFADYEKNELAAAASRELSALPGYHGPRRRGTVTPDLVGRGGTRGGTIGPYVSQFLVRDLPWTPIKVPQRIRTVKPGDDHMTKRDEWLAIQNGGLAPVSEFDAQARYIRNGRDLAEFVHRDFTYQAFLGAALILLKMSAPLDGAIPYHYSVNQGGFVTFGAPDILHFVAAVANLALKATWYQKWLCHRSARPEEIGARLPLRSEAIERVKKATGSTLLPQVYAEGAPSHPTYPAGHAAIAGACSTVLKAWFAESWVLPKSFIPSPDGLTLQPYDATPLTIGGELDKLAENIAYGRDYAGVHFRSDAHEGIRLGEAVALCYLREMKLTTREFFAGFSLKKFDGT